MLNVVVADPVLVITAVLDMLPTAAWTVSDTGRSTSDLRPRLIGHDRLAAAVHPSQSLADSAAPLLLINQFELDA